MCFKITEVAQPPGIDKILEARGYNQAFEISVQLMNIEEFSTDIDENVNNLETTEDIWLDSYMKMSEINVSKKSIFKRILNQVILPKCLMAINIKGFTIGCGLGVVEDNYIGLFDIVIDKQYRNRGLGQIMIENIIKWGKSKGATRAYLQVLTDNEQALRLYEKVGFKEVYKYWYRIKN